MGVKSRRVTMEEGGGLPAAEVMGGDCFWGSDCEGLGEISRIGSGRGFIFRLSGGDIRIESRVLWVGEGIYS